MPNKTTTRLQGRPQTRIDINMSTETPSFKYTADKSDPVAYLRSQDQMAREYEVKIQTVLLLQDKIKQCYRREGVNHYQNCRELTKQYKTMTGAEDFYSYKPPKSSE